MNIKEIMISNLGELSQLLDERGLNPADVREAIRFGQETGQVFYRCDDENRFLVRTKIGKFNVYAEYSLHGNEFMLHTSYSHRMMMTSDANVNEELKGGTKTDWSCYLCQVKVEEVDNIRIHYHEVELPDIDGYRCPRCKKEMIPENTVMTMLFMAEQMLEAK